MTTITTITTNHDPNPAAAGVVLAATGHVVLTESGRVIDGGSWVTFAPVGDYPAGPISAGADDAMEASGPGSWVVSVPLLDRVKIIGVEVEAWGAEGAIAVDAIIATAVGANLTASASAPAVAGWTTITVPESAILASWGDRRTITPPDAMAVRVTIANGGRLRRCTILTGEA